VTPTTPGISTVSTASAIEELFSFFVLSDIHCVGDDGAAHADDSLIRLPAVSGSARSPFNALLTMIERDGITADYLVCAGDLTNRAGIDGFRLGWERLEAVADALGASSLIFTPGNHDLDVHNLHGTGDIRICLDAAARRPALRPVTVTPHSLELDRFEIYERPDVRIINLDSNGREPTATMGRNGKVDIDTIDSLEAVLRDLSSVPFVVVFCHHHPYRHGDIDIADYSAMDGAPELFTMIERLPEANWLIVHGHKHYPRVATVSSRLTIFAAGSMAGSLRGPLQSAARNQCYCIKIVRDHNLGVAYPPVGEFQAWDWAAIRWIDALDGFNIPRFGGFGITAPLPNLAQRIGDFIRSAPGQRRPATEVDAEFPELKYLEPALLLRCVEILEGTHGIEVLTSRQTGVWRQLGVMT